MPISYKVLYREKTRVMQELNKHVVEQRDRLVSLCNATHLECHHLKEAVDIVERTMVDTLSTGELTFLVDALEKFVQEGVPTSKKLQNKLKKARGLDSLDIRSWPTVTEEGSYLEGRRRMITWSEIKKPNKECCYTHVTAETPLGPIRIEWKGWKERPMFDVTCPWGYQVLNAETPDEAMADVQKLWNEKMEAARELTTA